MLLWVAGEENGRAPIRTLWNIFISCRLRRIYGRCHGNVTADNLIARSAFPLERCSSSAERGFQLVTPRTATSFCPKEAQEVPIPAEQLVEHWAHAHKHCLLTWDMWKQRHILTKNRKTEGVRLLLRVSWFCLTVVRLGPILCQTLLGPPTCRVSNPPDSSTRLVQNPTRFFILFYFYSRVRLSGKESA